MHRQLIHKLLNSYAEIWLPGTLSYNSFHEAEEREIWQRFHSFVVEEPQCFERHCSYGHITGSALVVSTDWSQILLLLHRKLNKWLQLGGHSDGHNDPLMVAQKEAEEESGLVHLKPLAWHKLLPRELLGSLAQTPEMIPFDLDIHTIPARGNEGQHYHYDVRFLFQSQDPKALIQANEEAKDLRWIDLKEAENLTQERSMLRQFEKLRAIRELMT
ncbi:MAG: NUDIX hydrolase [Oligoflexus sp.]